MNSSSRSLDPNAVPPRSSKRKPFVANSEQPQDSNSNNNNNNKIVLQNHNSNDKKLDEKDHPHLSNVPSFPNGNIGSSSSPPSTLIVSASATPVNGTVPNRRLRANTVGWSGSSNGSHNNVPTNFQKHTINNNHHHNNNNNNSNNNNSNNNNINNYSSNSNNNINPSSLSGTELNSNAYFRRLSTLPEKKPNFKQRNKVIQVSRKLLFSFSELYSVLKRFNTIGNNEVSITERMAKMLSSSKRQVNHLVEVLESLDDDDQSRKSTELMLKVFKKNILGFKDVLQFLIDNLSHFTDKVDVCFIRSLLLTIFGCFNEFHNASITLLPSNNNNSSTLTISSTDNNIKNNNDKDLKNEVNNIPMKSVNNNLSLQYQNKQLSIPTSGKSQLAGARISVVDPKDDKLYSSSQSAINTAQRVCRIVVETMNKHINEKKHSLASELLLKCSETQDHASKLDSALSFLTKSAFNHTNTEDEYRQFILQQEKYKRIFLNDFDGFITNIISILALFKGVMNDFPDLMPLRTDMSLLSRTSKDLIALFKPEINNEMVNNNNE